MYGPNLFILTPKLGCSMISPLAGATVHVANVARILVESLSQAVQGNAYLIMVAISTLGVR